MYYVLHRPHGSSRPWLELPYRSKNDAMSAVKTLDNQTTKEGERLCDVKLCIGKGRDRRDILILEGEKRVY